MNLLNSVIDDGAFMAELATVFLGSGEMPCLSTTCPRNTMCAWLGKLAFFPVKCNSCSFNLVKQNWPYGFINVVNGLDSCSQRDLPKATISIKFTEHCCTCQLGYKIVSTFGIGCVSCKRFL